MSLTLQTLKTLEGSPSALFVNPLQTWLQTGVANIAGAGAGSSVAVAVTIPVNAGFPASGDYVVDCELGQDATCYITSKSATGFTVNLQPRLAANTLAAGTFNFRATYKYEPNPNRTQGP